MIRIRLVPFVAFLLMASSEACIAAAVLSPALERRLAASAAEDTHPVLLFFKENVDLAGFRDGRAGAPDLILSLQRTASRAQDRTLRFLASQEKAAGMKSFWINNSVALQATRSLIEDLATFEEIERIDFDEPVGFTEPAGPAEKTPATEWNIPMIGADQVWSALGYDGTGIVVGSMDTGVDLTHPALSGKWRGGTNSWIDIINGLPDPYDDHGHGTHTIGTMVGGDGPGPFAYDIGVCYGARFISAKVLDEYNSFSSASIVIAGAEWMLDPDGDPLTDDFPHVINNSWYFYSAIYTGFHSTAQAWVAAGIIPVFCIANEGPNSTTTRPPGSYNNTIGVGATDEWDVIASYSSRGPSPTGSVFPADRRKPDLSAPGDLVLSSVPGGFYQEWSGTSMASPHVAGTVALMLQAHPGLSFGDVQSILWQTSVDRGAAGYDYVYGYGRLDALAAVTAARVEAPAPEPPDALILSASPNPFQNRVRLVFSAPSAGSSLLELFDLQGRRVRAFAREAAGGSVSWDGCDGAGRPVPSGLYLVRLTHGDRSRTERVLRLR
jgi:bacillopeptidase F